ncbi:LacI family DNA-binding transcriptional regulator [Rhodobium gokarnense]|uniref:DNA-binding LacI/PurR family transcriptional regulator n=1 Tax=Rhodobium gokarnense TaxID=364296 RepID=A0ABT3H634_9HYPH|nr:LacI family DNA-binding transcriptional regulator [Rhodobium gokarnense]MCW2305845.1 DNA-binding LacI/PurR family transcriptional regulator [Rhodobium gokarnense]
MTRVTIKDVARIAGVSPSAVSRVFTDGASASEATREKVLAAARDLGYRPSLLARGLVGTRTNLVTLVMGRMNDPFDALFLDELAEALAARGTRLMLASAGRDAPGDSGLLQALDYKSDAVIVAAGTMSPEHAGLCVRAGLPVILSGRVLDAPGVDSVLADNVGGGRQAADLLIRTGCRRLAYLGRGGATFSDRERYEGFSATAANAGRAVATTAVTDRDHNAVFQAATDLLAGPAPPDGLFASTDSMAVAAVEAARAVGLSVPGDIAIVGFNNVPMAARRSYRLTTIDYPISAVVSGIMDLLDSRLADPDRPSEIRRIPTRLVVRETTREKAPAQERLP